MWFQSRPGCRGRRDLESSLADGERTARFSPDRDADAVGSTYNRALAPRATARGKPHLHGDRKGPPHPTPPPSPLLYTSLTHMATARAHPTPLHLPRHYYTRVLRPHYLRASSPPIWMEATPSDIMTDFRLRRELLISVPTGVLRPSRPISNNIRTVYAFPAFQSRPGC